MYYPEIKMYANKPSFVDAHFWVTSHLNKVGGSAGVSRGITGAWLVGSGPPLGF